MKFRQFWNVVPKAVQMWAALPVGCALLIALVAAYETAGQGSRLWTMFLYGSAGLAFGSFVAVWLVCLGFVYADARRRGMRAVLWVLVAGLFPHLLGFLLYFVLRQPIAAICTHCGMTISGHERFCSWCGTAQLVPNPDQGPLRANPSQGASL